MLKVYLLIEVIILICCMIEDANLACVTDSQSLMIKTQDTFAQSSNPASFSSMQCVYGETSGRLYCETSSTISSCSCNTQVISKIKHNGLSAPTVDWTRYYTTLSSFTRMNLGVMHNENYVFSAQYTGSDGILLKVDASNGDLSKSWKLTGEKLGVSTVYNRLVIDSSDSYLFMRGNIATQMLSYNIGTDAIIDLTSSKGNIYAYEQGTGGNSIIFGAHVASSCNFNIGTLDFGTATATYKTLAFTGSCTSAIKGTFAKDSSEDVAYLMVSKNPNTLFFSIKPSDLTLISSVYTFSTGCNPVTQVRKAGNKIILSCTNTSNLFSIYDTVGGTFTSVYSTTKSIFDVEYSKVGSSLAIITTGSSSAIPQVNSYALDYLLYDTSIFSNTAVTWTTATSGTDYTYGTASSVTFATKTLTIADYSGSLTTNTDITFSSSTSAYFQGYFTNTNVQTFQVPSSTTKSVDVNLSCLTNDATSVSYSLYAGEGSSVPSWITVGSSTGSISIAAPSSSSTNTFYLRETYSGDYVMTIDHVITVQVQGTSSSSSSSASSGTSTTTSDNSSSTSDSSSKSCIGIEIDSKVGCGFALTAIFLVVIIALAGAGFWISYFLCLKKCFRERRMLKEIKNCPPPGDEREDIAIENEICIGESIA